MIAEIAPASLGGADIDVWTPAHRAAYAGHLGCLKIIAETVPESLAVRDKDGRTPAYFAVEEDHAKCLGLCAKAAPESTSALDIEGETAAHIGFNKMWGNVLDFPRAFRICDPMDRTFPRGRRRLHPELPLRQWPCAIL